MLVVGITALFIDLSEYSIIYGAISVIAISMTQEKRKVGILFLVYVCICIVDMFFSAIVMFIFDINFDALYEQKFEKNCGRCHIVNNINWNCYFFETEIDK